MKATFEKACEAVSKSLVEFGYKDCTPQMVVDTFNAINEGKKEEDMPHGIIGRFAYSQIKEYWETFSRLHSHKELK